MKYSPMMMAMACLLAFESGSAFSAEACSVARAPSGPQVRIPFSVIDGRIYVEANVNGRGPFRFAVDTGASGVGRLDKSMLSKLDLQPSGRSKTSDAVNISEVETTHLTSVSMGSLERREVDLITRDYKAHMAGAAAFDGILGRDFFSDGLLIIDYGKHQISFGRHASLAQGDAGALSYERAFRVPITIGGKPYEANLDTGANVTMVVPRGMWSDLSPAPLELAAASQLTNTRIETSKGLLPGPVKIGNVMLADVQAKVSERFPEILIGAHALSSAILAIDQRSRTVAICPI